MICFFFYNHSAENWFQSVCLYLSVSVCLPVYLSLSVYMLVSDFLICLSICARLSVYLFMSVCTSVSVYRSVILTVFRNGRRDRNSGRQISLERRRTKKHQIKKPKKLIISSSFCVPLLEEFYHSLVVQPVESPGVESDRALGILLDISLEPDRMGSQ